MIIDKILLFFRPARRNFKFSENSKFSKSKLQGLGKNIFSEHWRSSKNFVRTQACFQKTPVFRYFPVFS